MRLVAFFELIRPLNSFMIGLAVIVGIVVSGGQIDPQKAIPGFLTGFFISSYSMVVNDFFDLEVDRINAPDRPLVRGDVKPSEAKTMATFLLSSGIVLSAITGLATFLLAVTFSVVSFLYNWKFKEYGFLGNLMVAASVAVPFIYGSLIAGQSTLLVLSLAFTAFFAGTGREIIKDIMDIEGDKIRNVKTIPIVYGLSFAGKFGALFFFLAIASSVVPAILGQVRFTYIFIIGVTDVLFFILAALIIMNPVKENAYRVKKIALYGMLLGLLGYLLEGLGG